MNVYVILHTGCSNEHGQSLPGDDRLANTIVEHHKYSTETQY